MMKYGVASRTFYRENPTTAGHPVMGTHITIISLGDGGPCLIGDSPVKSDEATKKNGDPFPGFEHNEYQSVSEEKATQIFDGKVSKLIADGYVFETVPDMRRFMSTREWVIEVHQHSVD
jgi:hypothetical protein